MKQPLMGGNLGQRTQYFGGRLVLIWLAAGGLLSAQDALDTLDPLVVTGSAFLERLSDAPVRTELLDGELIRRSQARTVAEAVEYAPGVRIDTACQNCSQQTVQMLGLPQPYIAILSDGLPVFSSLAGVYGIEQIPAGLFDRIEVVKGGGSVLYGSGAVAGVINLIPREPVESGVVVRTRLMEGEWFDSFVALKMTGPMDVPHIVTDATGTLVGNRLKRSPWFFNLDVGVSREFEVGNDDKLTVSLGVRNLLDDFQNDLDRGPYRDAGYIYGPPLPRTWYAGVSWQF